MDPAAAVLIKQQQLLTVHPRTPATPRRAPCQLIHLTPHLTHLIHFTCSCACPCCPVSPECVLAAAVAAAAAVVICGCQVLPCLVLRRAVPLDCLEGLTLSKQADGFLALHLRDHQVKPPYAALLLYA